VVTRGAIRRNWNIGRLLSKGRREIVLGIKFGFSRRDWNIGGLLSKGTERLKIINDIADYL
jgi:hypothetical protein